MSNLTLVIEGRYLDSYIYSGNLFLLDENYLLSIYKWDALTEIAVKGAGILVSLNATRILNDSSNVKNNDKIELGINKAALESTILSSIELNVWPSDINVFANILYISSETGVVRYEFDYRNGILGNRFKIFDEMSFSISPNSSNRIAIAAGKSGVLTFIPKSKFLSKSDISLLIESPCTDLDWQSTVLLANTIEGVKRADYIPMPIKSEAGRNFFEKFKEFKAYKPEPKNTDMSKLSWLGGAKAYSLNYDKTISIENIKSAEKLKVIPLGELIFDKIIKAKSSAFGAVLETENELFVMKDDSPLKVYGEPVNWRVFPRAKFYANHLHVITNDSIEVRIISSNNDEIMGFDVESIDLRG
jgi:hypothetical protein